MNHLPNYAICTPYWGAKDIEADDCKEWLKRAVPTLKHYRVTGCAYIDMARAALVRMVEIGKHQGLVFIDHDILFQPQDVVNLILAAEERQAVVSGVYCMRKSGDKVIGGFAEHLQSVTCFEGGGLYEGAWSGLGFTAIPWSVIEAVCRYLPRLRTPLELPPGWESESGFIDQVWPAFALDASEDWYNGEDISFLKRVRAAGKELFLDTRARLWHKGSYRYGLEDANVIVPRASSLVLELKHERPEPTAADAQKFEGLETPREAAQ